MGDNTDNLLLVGLRGAFLRFLFYFVCVLVCFLHICLSLRVSFF